MDMVLVRGWDATGVVGGDVDNGNGEFVWVIFLLWRLELELHDVKRRGHEVDSGLLSERTWGWWATGPLTYM